MDYNKNKFDDKLKKLYNESYYPKEIFENAYRNLEKYKIKKSKKFTLYPKLVACFIAFSIIAIFCIVTFTKKHSIIDNPRNNIASNNDENINNNNVDNDNSIYDDIKSGKANILLADSSFAPTIQLPNGLSYIDFSVLDESDCVAIVKLDKILYGMNYVSKTNTYIYPVTVSKFTIEKTYKGNLSGQIKLATDTETLLPINDYVKAGFIEDAARLGYNEMSEEERKNTYIKMPTLRDYTKLEENTYYIAYMKYNEDAELYAIVNYCFFEYNKDTNQIRIPETNSWEEFDLNGYDNLFIE